MKKPKTIQVDFDLFVALCKYFMQDETHLHEDIKKGLSEKVNKIIANQYFSAYKSTQPGEAREEWRKRYLDHIGIHKDWRSDTEKPEELPPDK